MSSDNITQNTTKSKSKYKKCNECDRYKKYFNEIHQICCLCYEIIIPSGNVALKELNNSKNISSKDLNELKISYNISLKKHNIYINEYYGIAQHPITQNFMIITNYYELGDLTHYITKDFFNISWEDKLKKLRDIATGIKVIHTSNIINNFFQKLTGDPGLSKLSLNYK
ncbi:kinase-like domain-containing protein [Rhizophagus irregularis DAOM 181602=DAOM 197198]|nr:kinase-like domain-containing protein [Rhizophagus irregularis DAOM 181602=DAOM 197198]